MCLCVCECVSYAHTDGRLSLPSPRSSYWGGKRSYWSFAACICTNLRTQCIHRAIFFCIRSHIDLQHSCSQVSALPVFLEMVSKWVFIARTEAVPNNFFYLFSFAIAKASLKYYHFQAYPLLLSVLTCFSGSCILQNSGSGAFAYLGHVNTFFYCKTGWNTDSQKALKTYFFLLHGEY